MNEITTQQYSPDIKPSNWDQIKGLRLTPHITRRRRSWMIGVFWIASPAKDKYASLIFGFQIGPFQAGWRWNYERKEPKP